MPSCPSALCWLRGVMVKNPSLWNGPNLQNPHTSSVVTEGININAVMEIFSWQPWYYHNACNKKRINVTIFALYCCENEIQKCGFSLKLWISAKGATTWSFTSIYFFHVVQLFGWGGGLPQQMNRLKLGEANKNTFERLRSTVFLRKNIN